MLETLVFLLVLGGVSTLLQKWAARKAGVSWKDYLRMSPQERKKAGIKI